MAAGRVSKPAGAVRIGDVARAAGVSSATVSRVLNGVGGVSTDRAERVRAAAEALGYQPFGPARALRQQRTRVWAAIVADVENPFFTAMVRGAEDVARDAGYRLVLCNSDNELDREAAYVDVAIAERMAGVIVAVASAEGSDLSRLVDAGMPVVAVDRRTTRHAEEVDSVVVDNRAGADLATDHLLAGGAERVACITGPAGVSTADDRLAGYRDALARHGRDLDDALVRHADFKQAGAAEATASLLAGTPRPDALFVANNLMTLGALEAVAAAGLRVPDDLAVVGFDDAPWTTLLSPTLSVVAQPTHDIGREAARLLATAAPGEPARHVVLQPTLVVRESSRPRR